jgi:hypothetical protein
VVKGPGGVNRDPRANLGVHRPRGRCQSRREPGVVSGSHRQYRMGTVREPCLDASFVDLGFSMRVPNGRLPKAPPARQPSCVAGDGGGEGPRSCHCGSLGPSRCSACFSGKSTATDSPGPFAPHPPRGVCL